MSARRIFILFLVLALLLCAVPVPAAAQESGLSSPEAPVSIPDLVPGMWYTYTAQQLIQRGANVACDDGMLHPYAVMTRYDFLRVLSGALGWSVEDAGSAAYWDSLLAAARNARILTEEESAPEAMAAPFCRFEMAELLYRAMIYVRGETVVLTPVIDLFLDDYRTAPQQYRAGINAAYTMGLYRGSDRRLNGWYGPTRAEGLLAILRLVDPGERYRMMEVADEDLPIAWGTAVVQVNNALGIQLFNRDFAALMDAHLLACQRAGCLPSGDAPYESIGQPITRYELAAFFDRIMTARGEDRMRSGALRPSLMDGSDIPEQYMRAVENCVLSGVIPTLPDGSFGGNARVSVKDFRRSLSLLFKPETRVRPVIDDEFTKVVGFFTTSFANVPQNSQFNACRAADFFHDVVLLPGQYLDFNKTAGDYNLERGFLLSSVYSGGGYVQGEGGGVCQASSTLYAAAVYANMNIHTRYNHAHKSVYIAPGLDATVFYPRLTLLISNPYDEPVKIVTKYDNRTLSFYFLGRESLSVPKVEVTVEALDRHNYRLTRRADGVVNYEAESGYGD